MCQRSQFPTDLNNHNKIKIKLAKNNNRFTNKYSKFNFNPLTLCKEEYFLNKENLLKLNQFKSVGNTLSLNI